MKGIRRFLPRRLKILAAHAREMVNKPYVRLRVARGIAPLSYVGGHDRGLTVMRYYTERFLERFTADIRGHCLEFQEPFYLSKYGLDKVTKIDILHVDNSNPKATLVADLTKPNALASNQFDCIICTFVLHLVPEFQKFIEEIHRILKVGGVLLIVVPHISMNQPKFGIEYWRFTPEGLSYALAKSFQPQNIIIQAYGNSLTAVGNIRGLIADEYTKAELDVHDPRFCSVVCARVAKAA